MPPFNRIVGQYRRDLIYVLVILVQGLFIWSQLGRTTDVPGSKADLNQVTDKLLEAVKLLNAEEKVPGFRASTGLTAKRVPGSTTTGNAPKLLSANSVDPFSRNVIHADLSARWVGNYEFHYSKSEMFEHMMDMIPKKNTSSAPARDLVVIVGFEKGDEAIMFVSNNLRVLAFEANQKWVDEWPKTIARQRAPEMQERLASNVRLVHTLVKAKDITQYDRDVYQAGANPSAQRSVSSEVVTEPIALLSVDTDGFELDVMRWAQPILRDESRAPWFVISEIVYSSFSPKQAQIPVPEAFRSNMEYLRILEENYILFGVCWWGTNYTTITHQTHYCFEQDVSLEEFEERSLALLKQDKLRWEISNIVAVRRGVVPDHAIRQFIEAYTSMIMTNPPKYSRIAGLIDEIGRKYPEKPFTWPAECAGSPPDKIGEHLHWSWGRGLVTCPDGRAR